MKLKERNSQTTRGRQAEQARKERGRHTQLFRKNSLLGESQLWNRALLVSALVFVGATACGAARADYAEVQSESHSLSYRASQLFKAKDYAGAEPLLRRAVSLDAHNKVASYNLGWCLYQLKKYREAIEPIRRAAELDPNDAQAKSMLAQCYREVGDYRNAAYMLEKDLRNVTNPKDKSSLLHELAFAYMKQKDFRRAADAYRQLVVLNPGDGDHLFYFAQALQQNGNYPEAVKTYALYQTRFPTGSHLADAQQGIAKLNHELKPTQWLGRWPSMPIPVCLLDPTKPVKGYRENYRALVGRAMKTWEEQTQGLVSFTFVDKPEKAKIVIVWTDDTEALKEGGSGNKSVGLTELKNVDAKGNILAAQISLLTISPASKQPFRDLALEAVALHEFGHAIGLPHSSNPGDVMFPWENNEGNTHTRLSARDLGWAKYLYSYKKPSATASGASSTTTGSAAKPGTKPSVVVRGKATVKPSR